MTIDTLTKEIETLKAEIQEMQVQRKRAGENREKENSEFQQTVADQRSAMKYLRAALTLLEKFYGNASGFSRLLQQEPVGPPPPSGFKTYKNNEHSGGVMDMIQQIIDDTKAVEAETIRAEEDAQKGYEDFVKDTNFRSSPRPRRSWTSPRSRPRPRPTGRRRILLWRTRSWSSSSSRATTWSCMRVVILCSRTSTCVRPPATRRSRP